jgi:hypothetical protein
VLVRSGQGTSGERLPTSGEGRATQAGGVAGLAQALFSVFRNPQVHDPWETWAMSEQHTLDWRRLFQRHLGTVFNPSRQRQQSAIGVAQPALRGSARCR